MTAREDSSMLTPGKRKTSPENLKKISKIKKNGIFPFFFVDKIIKFGRISLYRYALKRYFRIKMLINIVGLQEVSQQF